MTVTNDDVTVGKRWRTSWLAIFVLALGLILNLTYEWVARNASSNGSLELPVDLAITDVDISVHRAGFPFQFWYRSKISEVDDADQAKIASAFSAVALLLNLSVFAALAFVLGRRKPVPANSGRAVRISIGGVLLVTTLAAGLFVAWRRLDGQRQAHQALAQDIRDAGGGYQQAAWIPKVVAQILPEILVDRLTRIQGVRIDNADRSLANRVLDLRNLTTLRLGGNDYDLSDFEAFAGSPFLTDLRISGRELNEGSVHAIASLQQLHTLNLSHTNLSLSAWSVISNRTPLKHVSLVHTPVDLNGIDLLPIAKTLQTLWLPRPPLDVAAEINVTGLPRLRSLTIADFLWPESQSPLTLQVNDLPLLETLSLDVMQHYNLDLRDLPKLSKIDGYEFAYKARTARGVHSPFEPAVHDLTLKRLPALEEIRATTTHLKSIAVETDTPIYLKLYMLGRSASGFLNKPDKLPQRQLEAIIEGVGNSQGPIGLLLGNTDVTQIDLKPLEQNPDLFYVGFGGTEATKQQQTFVRSLPGMTEFSFKMANLKQSELDRFLAGRKNLTSLRVYDIRPEVNQPHNLFFSQDSPLQHLRLIDLPEFKSLDLEIYGMRGLREIELVDLPKLKNLELAFWYLTKADIRNNGLKKLFIEGEWPEAGKLADVPELESLAIGGWEIDDDVIRGLEKSANLKLLSIGYPGRTTKTAYQSLASARELEVLALPGTPIDDEVIATWPKMNGLTYLDLRDTDIGDVGLKKLLSGGQVKTLLLGGTDITTDALLNVDRLEELDVSGVRLSASNLPRLLSLPELRLLDVSDSQLDTAAMKALAAGGGNLQWLRIGSSSPSSESVQRLADALPGLRLDLDGTLLDPAALDRLQRDGRIATRRDLRNEAYQRDQVRLEKEGKKDGTVRARAFQGPAMLDMQMLKSTAEMYQAMYTTPPVAPATPQPAGGTVGGFLGGLFGGGTPVQETSKTDTSSDDSDDAESESNE